MRIGSAAEWCRWFRRGWPLWWSAMFASVGVMVWWIVPQTGQPLEWIGFAYQLIGVLSVVLAFRAAATRHGVRPVGARFIKYACACPFWRRERPINLEASPVSMTARAGVGAVIVSTGSDATLEERIALLERRTKALAESQALLDRKIAAEAGERAASLVRLSDSTEVHASRVRSDFRRIEVGGLKLSYFGLLWLVLGMMVSFFA